MAIAAIALGANMGDREATLYAAVCELSRLGKVIAISDFVDTAPVGYTDQPRFLNGAALLNTTLSPEQLLSNLLAVERQHGRDRGHGISKGPRTLDLDLLLYDDAVQVTNTLVLPHPEMHRRRFVLEPLAQIAPAMRHPLLHRTVADLLRNLHDTA